MEPTQIPRKLAQLLPSGGLAALTEGIEFTSLWRWIKLSVGVGLVVGLAAVGVAWILDGGHTFLLRELGDSSNTVPELRSHWWLLLLLPSVGGLAVGLISWLWAPEVAGAGVDPMIDAYHNRDGRMRRRVPSAKLIATLFTLGTGGSAGREGPMAQIGAGFGSYLATRFGLSARERRLLLLAGAAGGISALFRTPLGAALWSLEVLYKDDFESDGLFPSLVSSVTSYSVFTSLRGPGSLFSVLDQSGLPVSFDFNPTQLLLFAVLGLACGPLGALWIKWLDITRQKLWPALPIPVWTRPAVGGLLLGTLCVAVPWVFGSGTTWIQDALRAVDDPARILPIGYKGAALLTAIALAKMLATSLTVGSGGSGGVFAPSLFIGGFIGAAFGLTFNQLFPDIVTTPAAFVFVGMGAFYAGISRTPIATIILVSEMFGSYELLVPLMLTQMISTLLLRRFSLYKAQVDTARDSPAHRADYFVDVLAEIKVIDCYTANRGSETIEARMSIRDFLQRVTETADGFFIVRDTDDKLVGSVSLSNVRSIVTEGEFIDAIVVGDAMWPIITVSPTLDLAKTLDIFVQSGYGHLVVVDPEKPTEVMGMISLAQILSAYNDEALRFQSNSDNPPPSKPKAPDKTKPTKPDIQ